MSARNLGRNGTESRSAPEVSAIPRQLDLRVHDRVALDEIELYAEAMLYVDEDNVPAIKMYEGFGFRRWSADAMYQQRTVLATGDAPDTPRRS